MSFVITLLALGAAGLALLRVLRLGTGHRATDLALAWLVGTGWLAAIAPVVRFVLRVPLGRATLAGIVLAPIVLWAALSWKRPRRGVGDAVPESKATGWLPRPRWVFVPVALYVALVTLGVLLHGANTPTQTDDAVRVRAFAPMLAFADEWTPEARAVFSMAGPLPTFVPAVGWIATGTLDQFHVNYAILTELVALLVLLVGLGVARGSPERGWASALGILSIPLFLYHCTSTYSDAVLAMRVAGGIAFALEYGRTRDRADLSRTLLLLGLAALVKREGELVAAAPVAVLLAQAIRERWRGGAAIPWGATAFFAAPVALGAAGKIAAVGIAGAFPMVELVVRQAAVAVGAGDGQSASSREAAAVFLDSGLFRSGNQGAIFWLFAGAVVVRARAVARGPLLVPLLAVAALLAEVAVSSIVLVPEFTIDQSTVHRALLVASVPAAIWIAAAVVDGVRAEVAAAPIDAAGRAQPKPDGRGNAARPPRRRRGRRASRP